MASGSSKGKRSTGRRSTPARGKSRASSSRKGTNKRKGNVNDDGLLNEIVLIAVIAFSALLFLSNLGFVGSMGSVISDTLFGLFGYVSYLVPIALIAGAVLFVKDRDRTVSTVKIWAGFIILVILCSFSQLLFFKDHVTVESYTDFYTKCSSLHAGGGIVGGSVFMFLEKGIGSVGAVIVLIVLLVISVMLISEKSIISGVTKGGMTLYDNARNDIERIRTRRENERPFREEQKRIRQEEREAKREREEQLRKQKVDERNERLKQRDLERLNRRIEAERIREENLLKKEQGLPRSERKISGVMLDTKLEKRDEDTAISRDDMHEISYMYDEASKADNNDNTVYDRDIREIHSGAGSRVNRLEYGSVKSTHNIVVAPSSRKENITVSQAKKFGETAEFESRIINETLHLSSEYDYEAPVIDDVTDFDLRDDHDSFAGAASSVSEYMKPSVTIDETSYARDVAKQEKPARNQVRKTKSEFRFPPISLLKKGARQTGGDSKKVLDEKAAKLKETLREFGVSVTMTGYTQGPAITRFEMKPDVGVKVSKVLNLSDDIMLSMAAKNVRIEAPIPGKSLIGIELPNEENTPVMFRDLIESQEFKRSESKLSFAVGKGLSGETVVADIGKMPHMLIAGATGSGKSVCINTLIMSILYKARPDEVKLIMVDPKVVELSVYNGIPHLMIPVVTDPRQAAEALKWGVVEMDDRYNKFAEFGVRDLNGYNKKVQSMTGLPEKDRYRVLPRIIIIVDELADLMMVASKEVEESICRIAQKARAAGIHLVIATQRPSVDVVTGLIKANMPSRIAFSVSSGVDSRTILDMVGAEKLLGKGDMLFYPQGYTKPARVQGAFVSDQEVNDVVDFLKEHSGQEEYDEDVVSRIKNASAQSSDGSPSVPSAAGGNGRDELFVEAARAIIDKNKASIGMLQRLFKIGFNRAARIMDQLADAGVVGEEEGTKPRKVLMSEDEFDRYVEEYL